MPRAKDHNWTISQLVVITEYNQLMEQARSYLANGMLDHAIDMIFSAEDLIGKKMDCFPKREYTDWLKDVAKLKAEIIAANEKRNLLGDVAGGAALVAAPGASAGKAGKAFARQGFLSGGGLRAAWILISPPENIEWVFGSRCFLSGTHGI